MVTLKCFTSKQLGHEAVVATCMLIVFMGWEGGHLGGPPTSTNKEPFPLLEMPAKHQLPLQTEIQLKQTSAKIPNTAGGFCRKNFITSSWA